MTALEGFRLRKIRLTAGWLVLVSGLFFLPLTASADGIPGVGGSKRTTDLDFEDKVVEGVNKKPLDSLSQISDRKKGKDRPHLYRKKDGFRPETDETLEEIRFIQ